MSVAAKPHVCGYSLSRYPWYVRLILMLQRRKYGRALEPALLRGRMLQAFVMFTLLYRSRERAALAYAETVTESSRRVGDALFARLRQHFSDQEIVELTALIAYQNMSSKFNAALGVPAQGFLASGVQTLSGEDSPQDQGGGERTKKLGISNRRRT
ncbi:MAG: carboxymuconolactone decarboxylase family protein [Burkholderiales bacterium]